MYDYNISNTGNTMSIDYIWQSIVNYFIDNTININDTDTTSLKIKKKLLKYKRIIGLILLIILLLIGYYCEPYGNNSISSISNNKLNKLKTQKGSGFGPSGESHDDFTARMSAMEAEGKAAKDAFLSANVPEANAGNAANEVKKPGVLNRMGEEAQYQKTQKLYNYGARAGNAAKEWSGWLYSIIYSVAISLLLCIIIVPSIAFFIIGIICYFLLKNRMKVIKGF